MIRRLLWATLGAGLGISGYRRLTRVLRGFARPAASTRLRIRPGAGRAGAGGGIARFARDVRDGMDLHAERQRQRRLDIERRRSPAGHTLGLRQVSARELPAGNYQASRNGSGAHH